MSSENNKVICYNLWEKKTLLLLWERSLEGNGENYCPQAVVKTPDFLCHFHKNQILSCSVLIIIMTQSMSMTSKLSLVVVLKIG